MSQAKPSLQDMVNTLPRELPPKRDLWPGINHAINLPARTPFSFRPYALAASLLLVLGLSVFYGLRQPRPSLPDMALEAYISSLQSDHARSKQAVLIEFQQQRALYPQWEEQLHQLEQAEKMVYDALRRDPDNRELLNILRDVQAKQLKLIDAVFSPQLNTI